MSKSRLIAFATASAIALSSFTAPAFALGKTEKGIIAGIAAAVIIDQLISNNKANAAPQVQQPVHNVNGPHWNNGRGPKHDKPGHNHDRYDDRYDNRYNDRRPAPPPAYQPPRVQQPSVHTTPLGIAFKNYSANDRKTIQRRLRSAGFYNGAIDGTFGPASYNALLTYARVRGHDGNLNTTGGAYNYLNRILR